ncbi:SMI1-KNR4 cell-wall [Bacillus sp. OK838]|nr:SMI1-KNR4 cell-wall [Bacillus sp. OK838]
MILVKYSALQEFIKQYGEDADFTGGVSEDKVEETENKLQVPLPESYKWFLKNYGSGGSFGIDIIGYDFVGPSVVTATKDHQKYYDLIDGLVVIEDIDEFAYCLDTNKPKHHSQQKALGNQLGIIHQWITRGREALGGNLK